MAEEALKITITADNKQALAGLQQTVKSLDQVDKAAGATGGKVVKMGRDFTGLSRVIQDLPYGFNAISNNLTNLIPAAGALGLAFSASVAAFQIYSMGIENFMNRFFGFRKSIVDATKENEEFNNILAKEKTQLDLLFRTATNANVPLNARLNSVKELRSNYGAYLKDFSDEEILAGKAGAAYQKLSLAIVQAARARAAASLIEKKQLEKLQLEQEIAAEDAIRQQTKAAAKPYVTPTTMGAVGEVRTIEKQQATADAAFISRTKDKVAAIKVLDEEMKRLGVTYDENTVQLTLNKEEVKKGNTELEKRIKFLEHMRGKMLEESMRLDALSLTPPEEKPLAPVTNKGVISPLGELEFLMKKKAYQDDYNKTLEVANALTNMAMNNITGMVNAMQQGQSMGEALGNMFKNLAIQIALAAAKAALFQAILSLLPGGTAGAAAAKATGAAAGGGGFLKLLGRSLGFAEGGTVTGPKSGYPVMLHGTEHIVRPDQMRSIIASASQMGGGNSRVIVEGRIRGNDIFLSQQRTGQFRSLTT